MDQQLRKGRDRLAVATGAFLAANLLHGFDHQRTGIDRLTAEVKTGGGLITLAAIGTLWLAWRHPSRAPAVATFVGFWSALLISAAHFAAGWGPFSDSYWDLSPDGFSWFAAAAEVVAALVLGFVGLRQLLQVDRSSAVARARPRPGMAPRPAESAGRRS